MRTKVIILPIVFMLVVAQVASVSLLAAPKAALQAAPARVASALVATAASPVRNLAVIGQIGGVTSAVAVSTDGAYLYTNQGPRVFRWDQASGVPSPDSPVRSAILAGIPVDLKLSGSYLYVALADAGLVVLDATTLDQVSAYDANPVFSLAVGAHQVYAASGANGVTAFEFSGGASVVTTTVAITSATNASYFENVRSVAVDNTHGTYGYLYAAAQTDTAGSPNPGAIAQVPLFSDGTLDVSGVTYDNSPAGYTSMAVDAVSNHLYAVNNTVNGSLPGTFFIFTPTVSGPGEPETTPLTGLTASHLALDSSVTTATVAFVAEGSSGVDVVELAVGDLHVIFNVATDPNLGYAQFIAVGPGPNQSENPMVYIADMRAGVAVDRWVDPTLDNTTYAPDQLVPVPGETIVAAGANGQAYAWSNSHDVWTINAFTPSNLRKIGSPINPLDGNINAMTVYTANGTAKLYLADGANLLDRVPLSSNPDIFPDPSALEMVSGTIQGDAGYQVAITGTNAFVAAGYSGLATVDLTTTPMTVTHRITEGIDSDVKAVDVWGDYAYVLDNMDADLGGITQTLRVYDITNPLNPVQMITATTDILCGSTSLQPASDLKVKDGFIFLACIDGGVQVRTYNTTGGILDYVDSALPGDSPTALAVGGSDLYVANGQKGLARLAIAADGTLSVVDSGVALARPPLSLAVAPNGNVYVATSNAGLYVLQSFNTYYYYMPLIRK